MGIGLPANGQFRFEFSWNVLAPASAEAGSVRIESIAAEASAM